MLSKVQGEHFHLHYVPVLKPDVTSYMRAENC